MATHETATMRNYEFFDAPVVGAVWGLFAQM